MFVTETEIKNYRNYVTLHKKWHSGINILLGANAQGKTNFLESIYVMSMGKSHRTNKDKECIGWNADFAVIRSKVIRKNGPITLEIQISEKGKKAKINSLEQRRLSDYIGTLNVVLFAPEDLGLVKGAPGLRRRFLDMEIGQISPSYLFYLNNYNKILMQRNQLLKEIARKEKKTDLLTIWDDQLVEYGLKILMKRQEFMVKLKEWAKNIHTMITNGKEELDIGYQSSVHFPKDIGVEKAFSLYLEQVQKLHDKEVFRGISLLGPHRDDISFTINGQDVQSFGSQGQQRTTALSLKLAEIELINQEIGEYPVLLLDDVFSELDESRQTHLLEGIKGKCQTFVTTTSIDGIIRETLQDARVFWISQGTIENSEEGERLD